MVVYASQDQVYAEPILQDFTKQTRIRVRAVYDSEAVKTVGLANRLLAERPHPQCDLFWNNEESRARQLDARNALRETNDWAAMGYRSRRLVINTNLLKGMPAPRTLGESEAKTRTLEPDWALLLRDLESTTAMAWGVEEIRCPTAETSVKPFCHALITGE